MTGSIQGSAIDDSFETLTNAPDAWVSGRYAAPPLVDYQHYVEPGDTRSAVDDRCFTEYGAVEHTRHVNKTTKPVKTDPKHRRSRQTSTKPPSHGKRRPSPSFRIRSKDGDSVVVSNPFVLRKPSRPQPRREPETSSQTDDQSQHSSTTAAHSRTFQIRIRGKNGEEAIQEIKRPLHFAIQSGDIRESQATTLVGDDSCREDVKYWAANHSASNQKRDQRHKNKSGQPTFTDFVVDSSTIISSSTAGSSVKMSGALPDASPAPTTDSSRSRLLPPEKPASSLHDSGISVSRYPSKSPSRAASHRSKSSPENSSRTSSQNEVVIVPDESMDGSVVTPPSSLSTHCIVSSRPVSPITFTEPPEANPDLAASSISSTVTVDKSLSSASSVSPPRTSRMSSSRVVTLTESSRQDQEYQDDSRPVTVSLSKQKESKQEAYYNWKVPKDSLYSISTKSSQPSSSRHDPVASEKLTSASPKASSHHEDVRSRRPCPGNRLGEDTNIWPESIGSTHLIALVTLVFVQIKGKSTINNDYSTVYSFGFAKVSTNDVMSAQFPTRPISRLTGHNGQVLALCYSAGTGQYLLTGSTDRQIRLFNPATGLEVQKYSAHGYEVHDLSVAQDNDRFISVGGDKTVFLWDVATHQTLRRWSGHAGRINTCAFAGEGDSLVVTGSFDSTVKIWDCKQRSEKPIMTLSEAKDAVSSVSVSGAEIMAGSVDGRARCYDVRMGVIDQDVLGHPITSVTSTVNNDSYLASTLDSTLRLMDKRDGKLLQAFRHPDFKNENYRLRSTLAAGDSLAISGSEDGHIYVWDLLTGNLNHKLKHSNPALTDGSRAFVSMSSKRDVVNSVTWNQLRKEWASAGGDGSVVVWGA
ncbi:WD40 repeat-like protein, partial [Aureobasidium melanogenum]